MQVSTSWLALPVDCFKNFDYANEANYAKEAN